MKEKSSTYPFHHIEEELLPSAYELAYIDKDFMLRRDLRAVRLMLEFLKAETRQIEQHIKSTIVIFGSARFPAYEDAKQRYDEIQSVLLKKPDDKMLLAELEDAKGDLKRSEFYEASRKLANIITRHCQKKPQKDLVVVTGGGPGIMEAANRGADEAKGKSIGLNIVLPREQSANPYITPELNFQFHYFAIRKMHFLIRAKALVFFPGGYGTLDELFEVLTLIQTKKIRPLEIMLFNKEYWQKLVNFDFLVEQKAIDPEDIKYFHYVDTPEEAWERLKNHFDLED
ncbi:MAG: TIGR00730 family Rossman fold protein [Pseudomonadota bacterium]